MSSDQQFLICFCIAMVIVTFLHWLDKLSCPNIQLVGLREAAPLQPNPQPSPASGYRHVIDIHPANGLDRNVLKSLPNFSYDTSASKDHQMECAVCLGVFKDKDTYRELPACLHIFHVECIDMWFCSHSNCPLCRANVVEPVQRTAPSVVATAVTR